MPSLYSRRFGKEVCITRHARESMVRRAVDEATLMNVLEEGEFKLKNETHMWVFKHVDGREDNLICAAVVEETVVVIKTVMIEWKLEDE